MTASTFCDCGELAAACKYPNCPPQRVIQRTHFADENTLKRIAALEAENRGLRRVLGKMIDLAEYWFAREDRRGMSEEEFKIWHALGHGSNVMREARAALAAKVA
jgi:hypothetical protein